MSVQLYLYSVDLRLIRITKYTYQNEWKYNMHKDKVLMSKRAGAAFSHQFIRITIFSFSYATAVIYGKVMHETENKATH